jgi:deoxyribonuclease I
MKRANVLEWEHIVPFSWFYQGRLCATDTFRKANCTSNGGKVKRARKCCAKTDELANRFESDLFNLRPAAGEINGDRSNRRQNDDIFTAGFKTTPYWKVLIGQTSQE